MRFCIVLVLAFTLGCAQPSIQAYRPPPPVAKTVQEEPRTPPVRPAPQKPPAPKKSGTPSLQSLRIKIKTPLPTHLHAPDRSVMVLVPAGRYRVSSLTSHRRSASLQTVALPAFYIDRTEITVEQYQAFNAEYDETKFIGGALCPQCPAVGIDWHSAQRYCLWAGKKLPTEAQWEAAARGPKPQRLPWGDKHFPETGNLLGAEDGFDRLAPVGSYPLGASPFAALDMIGNAWEWVSPVTMVPPDGGAQPSGKKLQRAKGGSWRSPKQMAVISFRNTVDPAMQNPTFGLRCAKPASLPFNPLSGNK